MAKILLLETAGPTCSLAFADNGQMVAEYNIFGRNLHDRLLASSIKRMLSDLDTKVEQLDAIAVSAGPGSYTGLRIGGAVAKAICFDGSTQLIAVPTLPALAANAACHAGDLCRNGIVAVAPSHKDLLYYQEFSRDGKAESEVLFADSDEFNRLPFAERLVVGLCPDEVTIGAQVGLLHSQTAAAMMVLSHGMFQRGEFVSAESYEPIYIQEFEPKIRSRI